MKILSLLIVLFSFLVVEAQVYPYAYYPEAHTTSSRKMGIVDANNKKVTEPIFDEIAFFKNQPRNRYTVFYTKVENEVDGVMKASFESGIINTRGEIIPGIKAKNLKYDGNGRIAYSDDPALELYNIKTAKSIYKKETGAEIRVNEIISGDIYYMILFNANTKNYSVLDENGEVQDVTVPVGSTLDYCCVQDGEILFEVNRGRRPYFLNLAGNKVPFKNPNNDMPEFMDMSADDFSIEPTWNDGNAAEKYPAYKLGDIFKNEYGEAKSRIIIHDNAKGLMNIYGNVILPCEYTAIREFYTDINEDNKDDKAFLELRKFTKSGISNLKGKIIVPLQFGLLAYDRSTRYFTGMSANRYWGYIGRNGKVYLPKECECLE